MEFITMNRLVSLNNFPSVRRRYCLTRYHAVIYELVRSIEFLNRSFYILERDDILEESRSNDDLVANILFFPQRSTYYNHLDIFCENYLRIGKLEQISDKTEDDLCEEFIDEAVLSLKREILEHISEASSEGPAGRLTRSLIGYGRVTNCIFPNELIPLTMFCLTTLYVKNPEDYDAVVQVLINFCSPGRPYLIELFSRHSVSLTRYILDSCVKGRFNFRNFILQHPAYGEPGRNPICPVLENLLQGNHGFLHIYLEFGFELYPPNYQEALRYGFHRVARCLFNYDVNVPWIPDEDTPDDHLLRYNLALNTTYFLCASIQGWDGRVWPEITRLIWKSIPDPYLKVSEVARILEGGADEEIAEGVMAQIETTRYRGIFRETIVPRRLLHLCRCAVRAAMGRSFRLPDGIHELMIPRTLIDYLDIFSAEDDH